MGEPIKQLGFRLDDPDVLMTNDRVQMHVYAKGPEDKGTFSCTHLGPKAVYLIYLVAIHFAGKVYLWAKLVDGKWSVTRVELELDKHPGKRLLIKDGPRSDDDLKQ